MKGNRQPRLLYFNPGYFIHISVDARKHRNNFVHPWLLF